MMCQTVSAIVCIDVITLMAVLSVVGTIGSCYRRYVYERGMYN